MTRLTISFYVFVIRALWVCLYIKVYLIYHFIYLLFLFSVKRAYGGFLAIQCLVILCILALKVMDIQIDFIRWLSVYKNIKKLFLIKTFMVIHVVTDKYRPVFVVLFFLSKVSISVQLSSVDFESLCVNFYGPRLFSKNANGLFYS